MRRVRRRRRRLPLTPLIDVIFLLLLFFMLSSSFLHFADVEVASAGAASSGPATPGTSALLSLGADGALSLNGEAVAADGLIAALERLRDGGAERLILAASDETAVQGLVDVLGLLEGGPMPVILAGGAPRSAPAEARP